jgi:hypothetical protein
VLRHSEYPRHPWFSADSKFPRFNASTLQRINPASANRNQLDAELRRTDKETVGKRKILHIFLVGMLCGVMTAAAFTYVFAIPANNYYWRMEIWNRGGATLTFDRNGRWDWEWVVEPIADTPRQKPVTVPSSQVNVRTEQL